jgi:hypothetical protein
MSIKRLFAKLTYSIIIVTTLLSSGIVTQVTSVQANHSPAPISAYNRSAAVKWALKNNYNDGRLWGDSEHGRYCTTYVTRAMQAGGISIPSYTGNVQLALWLKSNPGSWEIRPKEQLEPGDIIFLNNAASIPDNLDIKWIDHVVMITGKNKYSAWNAEFANRNISKLAKWKFKKGIHFLVNSTVSPSTTPPVQFLGNVTSVLSDNHGSADLKICAGNLPGSTVYVLFQMENGRKKDGSVKWVSRNFSKLATTTCVIFKNLDGKGSLAKNVRYISRAALNQQPNTNWSGADCYESSGNQGLCNILMKNNKK